MRKKIIIIAMIFIAIVIVFQFACPLIVTECDYTVDPVSDYELRTHGIDTGDSVDNYLKLQIYFTIMNLTAFEPKWSNIEIETLEDYEFRVVYDSSTLEDADRFSNSTYLLQIILNITGMSDDEITAFIEGLTVRAKNNKTVNVSENDFKSTPIEFVIADKLKEK